MRNTYSRQGMTYHRDRVDKATRHNDPVIRSSILNNNAHQSDRDDNTNSVLSAQSLNDGSSNNTPNNQTSSWSTSACGEPGWRKRANTLGITHTPVSGKLGDADQSSPVSVVESEILSAGLDLSTNLWIWTTYNSTNLICEVSDIERDFGFRSLQREIHT